MFWRNSFTTNEWVAMDKTPPMARVIYFVFVFPELDSNGSGMPDCGPGLLTSRYIPPSKNSQIVTERHPIVIDIVETQINCRKNMGGTFQKSTSAISSDLKSGSVSLKFIRENLSRALLFTTRQVLTVDY